MSLRSRMFKWYSREFQKRLEWNGGPDRELGHWKLIDVNGTELIPGYLWEFDYWCSDGKGVYILRLCWAKERSFHVVKSKGRHRITYLEALCQFDAITNELIQEVLSEFDRLGIPKWTNGVMKLTLPITD